MFNNPDSITKFEFRSFMTRFKFFRRNRLISMDRFFINRSFITIIVFMYQLIQLTQIRVIITIMFS